MTVTKKLIGRLPILIGEYDSTKTYSKKQRVTLYGSEFESLIDNNTYVPATLDNDKKVVTFDTEHWTVISNGTGAFLAGEKLDQFSFQENPEFVNVETDSDGKLIESTDTNGKKTIYGDLEVKGSVIKEGKDIISDKQDKEAGKSLIDEDYANAIKAEDIPEGRLSIETDKNDKVLSYRDEDGVLHEEVGIKTSSLNAELIMLSDKNVSDLANDLAKGGYMVTDWSNAKEIHLPIPKCARINITSSDGSAATWPTTKSDNKKYWMQFWDMQGNYFKKRIIFNAQGSSSMSMPKKNGAIDICNDEWKGDDTFSISFGEWVYQDSFHFKAFYNDGTKSLGAVAYQLFDEISKTYSVSANRTYKRALLNYSSSANMGIDDNDDLSLNFDNGARCFPDMFPCVIYLDKEFYGIYSFALKKHRDNYHMKKNNDLHIHVDCGTTLPFISGMFDWGRLELRNPKGLYYQNPQTINGKQTLEYDGDFCAEIMGEDSEYYGKNIDGSEANSKTKKQMALCAKVKKHLKDINSSYNEILAYIDSNPDNTDEIKAKIASLFDVQTLLDYMIVTTCLGNFDSLNRNVQWTTWDNKKWFANPYDWDTWAGSGLQPFAHSYTNYCFFNYSLDSYSKTPYGLLHKYYWTEEKVRYKELKEKSILTSEHIVRLINNYMMRFGNSMFKKEYEKWNEAPCWRDSYLDSEHWELEFQWNSTTTKKDYDNTKTYAKGDEVLYGSLRGWKFKSKIDNNLGNPPLTSFYNLYPQELGYHESIYRIKNWLDNLLLWCDSVYK